MKQVTVQLGADRAIQLSYREGSSDRAVIKQIWETRDYDLRRLRRWPDIRARYQRIIADGHAPLIVDAGANIGASSVYFAETYPQSVVLAIEPEKQNFALLQANAAQHASIRCLDAALSSADGQAQVVDAGWGSWGFRTAAARTDGDVSPFPAMNMSRAVSMNTLIETAPANCIPFIVKIDIEGGETDVFSANLDWIEKFHVLIIELHDWMLPGSASSQSFLRAIAPTGRDFVHIGENIFSISNAPA